MNNIHCERGNRLAAAGVRALPTRLSVSHLWEITRNVQSGREEIRRGGKSKADKKKSDKLKARLPRGLTDRGPQVSRGVAPDAGEDPRGLRSSTVSRRSETPLIEYTDALGKFPGPDQDRPNEGVFSFQDDDGAVALAAL